MSKQPEQCSHCGLARYLAIQDERCNCGEVFPSPSALDIASLSAYARFVGPLLLSPRAQSITWRWKPHRPKGRWRAALQGMIEGAAGAGRRFGL